MYKFKYITLKSSTEDYEVKYPALDSGIDDYIHELIIRNAPEMYNNNDEEEPVIIIYDKFAIKTDTIDNILSDKIVGNNRQYYFDYIKKNLRIFEPSLFFNKGDILNNVFKFLRVNLRDIHGII